MWTLKNKKIFLLISIITIISSVGMVAFYGLNPSIDFAGGTIYEIEYVANRPSTDLISSQINTISPGTVVQTTGMQGLIIKSLELSDEQKSNIETVLAQGDTLTFKEMRFKQLGPAVSGELVNKSLFAIAFVILIIILFIAYTFRTVSRPVSSFKFGLVAIIALVHDTIIPLGIFALLGSMFISYQIDVLFVTALLATLGYSINDTIIVFDRVRENLRIAHEQNKEFTGKAFEAIVGHSLSQTFMRSLYTSLTTLVALSLLFFLGGEATKPFALILGCGIIAGTFSSLFLACPLLVILEKMQKKVAPLAEIVKKPSDLPDDIQKFLNKQSK